MSYVKLLIWVIVLTFCSVILIQNGGQLIKIRFLMWETREFEAILLFLLGVLLGVITVIPTIIRQTIHTKRNVIERQQKQQEKGRKRLALFPKKDTPTAESEPPSNENKKTQSNQSETKEERETFEKSDTSKARKQNRDDPSLTE
jgi:uncharacterized membrane protein YciS (DUF1049 family)